MNKHHKRRLYFIFIMLTGISIAVGLMLFALKRNINVFVTPTQLIKEAKASNFTFRLGGMVKKNSIVRGEDLAVHFVVTDLKHEVPVLYKGILPDLFKEQKGVVVEGRWENGQVIASQVLAKHDENYMPKEVYEQLRKNTST